MSSLLEHDLMWIRHDSKELQIDFNDLKTRREIVIAKVSLNIIALTDLVNQIRIMENSNPMKQ